MGTAWNKTVESASKKKKKTIQYDASVGHRTDFVFLFARDIFMQYLPALEILSEEVLCVCVFVCMLMFKLFINWTEGKNGSKFWECFSVCLLPFAFHFKRTEWTENISSALVKSYTHCIAWLDTISGKKFFPFIAPFFGYSHLLYVYTNIFQFKTQIIMAKEWIFIQIHKQEEKKRSI